MKDTPFTADRLLALYDRVAEAEAEDAIPRLRRFVLDLAVRGKLVEQDQSDQPIPKRFQNKDNLVLLPTNWGVVNFGKFCDIEGGNQPAKSQFVHEPREGYVQLFQIRDLGERGVPTYIPIGSARSLCKDGEILIGRYGASVGKVFWAQTGAYNVAMAKFIWPQDAFISAFAFLLLKSDFLQGPLASITRSAQAGFNKGDLAAIDFPLPPLAEQQRIVAKVDDLMALCDQLEQARAGREAVRDRLTAATWARLTAPETDAETLPTHARAALQTLPTLTTRPDQIKTLRQTILNLAVRGKLVEQGPTDEPAAELLKRIAKERNAVRKRSATFQPVTEDEQNFPAPKGWKWQRFGEVFSIRTGFAFQSSTYTDSGILVLRVVNFDRSGTFDFSDAKYFPAEKVDTKISQFLLRAGEILMVMVGGTIGKTTVVAEEILPALLNQNMWRIRSYGELMNGTFEHMLIRYLNQNIENLTNSTHGHFAMGDFEQKAICVPPLAEQHRIVAKVDALLALCDQLESSLTTATTTRSRLLEALLHEALGGQTEAA